MRMLGRIQSYPKTGIILTVCKDSSFRQNAKMTIFDNMQKTAILDNMIFDITRMPIFLLLPACRMLCLSTATFFIGGYAAQHLCT